MKIEVMDKGPYIVRGESTLVNKDGSLTKNKSDIYLCRCGKSARKPYCDGSHHNLVFD